MPISGTGNSCPFINFHSNYPFNSTNMKKRLLSAISSPIYIRDPAFLARLLIPAAYFIERENPDENGFSSERLKRIDATLQEYADKKWMNGAVALVVHDGKIVYYKSFGYDDLDTKKPMAKDPIFRIASQTKKPLPVWPS